MSRLGERPWLRIGAESLAIVASILVAFGIDAWWDGRNLRSAETQQLNRVVAELETNAERIQEKLNVISAANDAGSKLMSWLGPEPEMVPRQEFSNTFIRMYGIGTLSLLRSALNDYLAAGRIDLGRSADLREAIADWYSEADRLEGQYALLREAHGTLDEYLRDTIPMLHLDGVNAEMAKHAESRFPFDQVGLMSDPRFESQISLYLVRLEFTVGNAISLLENQPELLALLEQNQH